MFLLLTLLTTKGVLSDISVTKAAPAFRAHQPVLLSWAQQVAGVHRFDSLQQVAASRRLQTLVVARLANTCCRAADSLRTAFDYKQQELASVKAALVNTNVLPVSQAAKTDKYRSCVHRKGWGSGGLSALVAGLVYGHVAR